MIDTLVAMRGRIELTDLAGRLDNEEGRNLVVALHRPVLTDAWVPAAPVVAYQT